MTVDGRGRILVVVDAMSATVISSLSLSLFRRLLERALNSYTGVHFTSNGFFFCYPRYSSHLCRVRLSNFSTTIRALGASVLYNSIPRKRRYPISKNAVFINRCPHSEDYLPLATKGRESRASRIIGRTSP